MAGYFSITRPYLSPDLLALKKYVKRGDKILDLGCGNGRLTQLFEGLDVQYTGLDVSKEMIGIAKQKYPKYDFVIQNNPLGIDYPDNTFDIIFCLSVFHHIPSDKYRIDYLKEINRVLKPNGILILTVWNLWRRPNFLLELISNKIRNVRFDFGDLFIKFKDNKGKELASRYHHAFTKSELSKLFESTVKYQIESIKYSQRGQKLQNENIVCITKKV